MPVFETSPHSNTLVLADNINNTLGSNPAPDSLYESNLKEALKFCNGTERSIFQSFLTDLTLLSTHVWQNANGIFSLLDYSDSKKENSCLTSLNILVRNLVETHGLVNWLLDLNISLNLRLERYITWKTEDIKYRVAMNELEPNSCIKSAEDEAITNLINTLNRRIISSPYKINIENYPKIKAVKIDSALGKVEKLNLPTATDLCREAYEVTFAQSNEPLHGGQHYKLMSQAVHSAIWHLYKAFQQQGPVTEGMVAGQIPGGAFKYG